MMLRLVGLVWVSCNKESNKVIRPGSVGGLGRVRLMESVADVVPWWCCSHKTGIAATVQVCGRAAGQIRA